MNDSIIIVNKRVHDHRTTWKYSIIQPDWQSSICFDSYNLYLYPLFILSRKTTSTLNESPFSSMNREALHLPTFSNLSDFVLNVSFDASSSHLDKTRADSGSILTWGGRGHGGDVLGNVAYSGGLEPSTAGRGDAKVNAEEWGSCRDWQDAQHTLFQLANLCAAISLLTPSSFRYHLLFLRCFLLAAFLFFVLWASLFVCMLDILIWNCVFFVINLIHVICLAYHNIPVSCFISFLFTLVPILIILFYY